MAFNWKPHALAFITAAIIVWTATFLFGVYVIDDYVWDHQGEGDMITVTLNVGVVGLLVVCAVIMTFFVSFFLQEYLPLLVIRVPLGAAITIFGLFLLPDAVRNGLAPVPFAFVCVLLVVGISLLGRRKWKNYS